MVKAQSFIFNDASASAQIFHYTVHERCGWKQMIIGTGDQSRKLFASCIGLEMVVQSAVQGEFPRMYVSCTGSTSHDPYSGFEDTSGAYDFELENARLSPYCRNSQNGGKSFPTTANCFGHLADEWTTIQVGVRTGPCINGDLQGNSISLWVARDRQPSEFAIEWGPCNRIAVSATRNQRSSKIWLLPCYTAWDPSQIDPIGFTWYGDLIISRPMIPDPYELTSPCPNSPTNGRAQ